MTNFSKPPLVFLTRATSTAWQDQLRVSVRLYLSLNANPALDMENELESLLRRSEQELLDYLLAGTPPTPAERQRAQEFLDRAQHQLLSSPTEVQQLLAELSAENTPAPAPLRGRGGARGDHILAASLLACAQKPAAIA